MEAKKQGYYVEWNGDAWQSIFPSNEAEFSQLHFSIADAIEYMRDERSVIECICVKVGDKIIEVHVPKAEA